MAGRPTLNLDAGHNEDRTTLRQKLSCAFEMLEKAQEACERLQDYLHDVRLGTLDPYNVFEVWYILEGPGELVSQYWSRNMLPGLMKDDVKLLKLLHARGVQLYHCTLKGLKDWFDGCQKCGRHPCVRMSTGMKAAPFQRNILDLLPHDGRGPLKCHSMHTDQRCWYHHAVFTAYLAVSNDFFFKHRWDNLSDVREPIAMAAPPLLLFDFKNAKYPLHIATVPTLTNMSQRAELVRFWLTGGALLGQLQKKSQLSLECGLTGSVFDCHLLLDPSGLALADHKDLYAAAMPLMDIEVHFLKDGSQHVRKNVKITNVQHNLAKGHTFLPLHADMLEVALISHQLIGRMFPEKTATLTCSIEAFLSRQDQVQASRFFISNAKQARHTPLKRRAGDNAHFDVAQQNLIRGSLQQLALQCQGGQAYQKEDKELGTMAEELYMRGRSGSEEYLQDIDMGELDAEEDAKFVSRTKAVDGIYFRRHSVQEAARKVLEEMECHFAVVGNSLQDVEENQAGFPILVGDATWTWDNMVRFYANCLERSYVCELVQNITDEQKKPGAIRGVVLTHHHLSQFQARSPVTLMLTHYC